MSVLAGERHAIAEALVGEMTRFEYVPDRLVPPAAIITPGSPYLDRAGDDPFGTMTARFEVWLVRPAGTNEQTTTDLDDTIEAEIDALTAAGFVVASVGEPFIYTVQGANLLAAILHVETGVTFTR